MPSRIIAYLFSSQEYKEGPLFIFKDGRPLTRQRLVTAFKGALQAMDVDQFKYCGHSSRVKAAMTAAARGMEDSIIKTLGRWSSAAVAMSRSPESNWLHIPRYCACSRDNDMYCTHAYTFRH